MHRREGGETRAGMERLGGEEQENKTTEEMKGRDEIRKKTASKWGNEQERKTKELLQDQTI